jgi:hypothetical protein
MRQKNRYNFYRYALLLIPLLSPVFINSSVVNTPLLPPQNPTATAPRPAVGTTDSLQQAQDLLQQKKHKEALQIALDVLKGASEKNDSTLVESSSYLIGSIFNKSKKL